MKPKFEKLAGKGYILVFLGVLIFGGGGATALFLGGFGGGTTSGLRDGLVGYWKLDGNPNDATVYNNHGTVNGDDGGVVLGESGTFTSRADAGWKKIEFANPYTTPVVVGTNNTHNGENALVFESRNVTNTSAEMRLCESEGSTTGCDTHESETAGYMVIDADDADSVAGIEAGTFDIDGEMDTTSTTVSFGETFGTAPKVMTTVNTVNGTAPVEGQTHSVTTTDFVGAICQQNATDSCDDTHPTETVGWVAVEPGNEPFNEQSEAAQTGDSVSHSEWTSQTFSSAFSEPPVMIVETQTNDGGQDALVDETRNITTTDAEVRYCEMESGDTCDTHTTENVGWLAVEHGVLTTGDMPAHPTIDRQHNKNGAYVFDGVNDYIEGANNGNLTDWPDGTTVSVWVKSDTADWNDSGMLVSKRQSFILHPDSGSKTIRFYRSSGGSWDSVAYTSSADLTQWNHYVGTYDNSNLKLYENGELKKSKSVTSTIDSDTGNVFFGRDDGLSRYLDGRLDGIRLYNRALSSDEISKLYDSYHPEVRVATTQKNLASHWKMDGNGNDATPYSNHGTVNGATATTDRYGQSSSALDFDGTDDDITGTDQPNVQTSPNLFTASGYINSDDQETRFITPQSTGRDQWIGYDAANERLEVTVAESANTNVRRRYSTTGSVPLNSWTHWSVVINDTTIKIYINGELDQEYNESISIAGWENEWRIGQRGNDTYWLLGKLDDVRVHGRELSPSEIRDLHDSYQSNVHVSDLQKGLKNNWSLNGDVKDKTPYAGHGTVNGPILATDRHGRADSAYDFDGTDDYIALDNLFDTSGALPEFTVTAWVKIPSGGGDWAVLDYDRSEYFTFAPGNDGSAGGVGDIVGCHTTDSGGSTHDFGGNEVVRDGSWHFAACVYDGTDKIIYVDGTEDARASNPHSGAAIGTGTTRYGFIGDGSEASSFDGSRNGIYFEGQIGNVRFYDRALSSTEIETLSQIYH